MVTEMMVLLAKVVFIFALCIGAVPFCVWFERRGSAWMQGRLGPNRLGPFGLFQLVADMIKFFFKESFIPQNSHKFLYLLAPAIALVPPMAAIASIPFCSEIHLVNLNVGVLLILAFTGLEIYPIILSGWASNNKYSMLGALRASSQLISYEISMSMALLSMLLVYGTFDLTEIIRYQQEHHWGVLLNPLAALIFWVATYAETNRLPFDLAEGDSEIVAGYHLEYGAMKFAIFFMSEYVAMIMVSAFLVTLFFGGYALLPGMSWVVSASGKAFLLPVFELFSFFLKVAFFMFLFVWVRWSLPRFRFDQLMHLGWNILFPLSLANLLLMGAVAYFLR
ncbi:MAG: NADH-quinone oxidoreductase subunit NuoH [Oligoflexia bacterium]|nr:NADH-quinone oxidoreductase subunit NuoH [Oligoflexia bacterium]MBF0364101.1 NADH-quinone oxidoreductase subunit NuoH [Oligoflexia bacterium]